MISFFNKEWLENIRNGKIYICAFVFAIIGVLSPAIAKLTPELYKMFADDLKESGMVITEVKVTAFDSYAQFYKNMPMALIAFVLLFAGFMTVEYQRGTLVMMITKGLSRRKVLYAKSVFLFMIWTVMYFTCFFITHGYTLFYWDVSVVKNLAFAVVIMYVFGIYVLSLMILFSVISKSMSGVLIGCGGVVFAFSLLSIIPKCAKYFPNKLMDGMSLLKGNLGIGDYKYALLITAILIVFNLGISSFIFKKKAL